MTSSLDQLVDRPSDPAEVRELFQNLAAARATHDGGEIASAVMPLAAAYRFQMDPPDLERAEICYRAAHDLLIEEDARGRGICRQRLASTLASRYAQESGQGASGERLVALFEQAVGYFSEALALFPLDLPAYHAETHHQIGDLYNSAGLYEEAVQSYHTATAFDGGDLFAVSRRQLDMVFPLASLGRLADAQALARKALEGFEASVGEVGPEAQMLAGRARQLLAMFGG